MLVQLCRVIKELLAGETSTRLEGAGAIDVPALLDREYRLNLFSYTQVRPALAADVHSRSTATLVRCIRQRSHAHTIFDQNSV